jgi:hypothetical protein
MTTLPPPNIFNSGGPSDSPPDEAATPTGLQASGVAADIQSSCGGVEGHALSFTLAPKVSTDADVMVHPAGIKPGPQDAISLSELIDRGFDVEAFMLAIEPPPLFLQRVG